MGPILMGKILMGTILIGNREYPTCSKASPQDCTGANQGTNQADLLQSLFLQSPSHNSPPAIASLQSPTANSHPRSLACNNFPIIAFLP